MNHPLFVAPLVLFSLWGAGFTHRLPETIQHSREEANWQVSEARASQLMGNLRTHVGVARRRRDEGGWVSGGGDHLRQLIVAGQLQAIHILDRLDVQNLSDVLRLYPQWQPLVDWLALHRQDLMAELTDIQLTWVDTERHNCAVTQPVRGAPIELSIPACRTLRTADEAAALLIHESLHHLGISDEWQADQWASILVKAWNSSAELEWCQPEPLALAFADRLAGRWQVEESLSARLRAGGWSETLEIKEDKTLRDKFPGFFQSCALTAGTIRISRPDRESRPMPFVVIRLGLHANLVFLEGEREDGTPDFESFFLTLVPAERPENDLLFVGDDHPEPMSAFQRRRD